MHPHPEKVRRHLPVSPAKNARAVASLLCAALAAASLVAEPAKNFGDLTMEELMNETVTSVSKKEQKLSDAAAAVSVLSNEDLRRSGATSVSDALRLVPGMDVGAINSSHTAVSSRGFNGLYANKLLVLIDGRAVYTPLFGGVYWDLQQTMMEDVDRIEVIRGPGATLWGANAVNGVVNVVTRSARDTQGGLIYGGGGDVHETMGGVRYGGQIDEHTYYRVYATEQSQDDYSLANGLSAGDAWSSQHGGFRVDRYVNDTHLTWQGDMTAADLDDHASDAYNVNSLGRWTRTLSDRSEVEAQVYYDRTHRDDLLSAATTVDTVDFTLQHSFGLGERNDAIWGVGYRFIDGTVKQTSPAILVHDTTFSQHLFNAFVQDAIKLVPDRLTLTLGTKVEHNDYTGFEIQPSVSMVFKPAKNQTLWASISRAVRTPTVLESRDVFAPVFGAPFVGPGGGLYVPALTGNPDVSSETLWAYELGWRIQPTARVNVDVAVFYNDYNGLIVPASAPQFVPGVPVGLAELPWVNGLTGHTYGGEAAVTVSPTDEWRLTAAYSLLVADIQGPAPYAANSEESAPRNQLSLRSAYDITPHLSIDGQLRYVDSIQGVPAYLTADLRLSYRPNDHLEFSLVSQNLLDAQHPEQPSALNAVTAEVPRGFYAKILYRF